MFQNMKIGRRMGLAFSAMISMSVLVGYLGVT